MPRRPRKGSSPIVAAVAHFAAMGYAESKVRSVVRDLVKVYGGPSRDVWRFLEQGSYEIVRNRFFQMEEEDRQKQDAQLLLDHPQQDDQQVEDEPPQHQKPAADDEMEDPVFIEPQDTISISNEAPAETSNEAPAETKSADNRVGV